METKLERRGLNEAEASIARALAAFGGSSDLLDGLEPGAAQALRPLAEELEEASEDRRGEVLQQWRAADSGLTRGRAGGAAPASWESAVRSYTEDEPPFEWIDSNRMRRVLAGAVREGFGRDEEVSERRLSEEPEHFDVLLRLEAGEFSETVFQFGVFQVAQLVRDRNRRRIARVADQLPAEYRDLYAEAVKRDIEVDRRERTRLREVFVTLTQHYEGFRERLEQFGLYFVARAASRRFRGRLSRLERRLPDEVAGRLMQYYRMARASSRKGLSWRVRSSLETFLELRRELERREGDD